MRKWLSHKIVEAEPITAVGSDYVSIAAGDDADGWTGVEVPGNFFARGTPEIGDYVVRYEDGYLSHSPKAAFEGGYTEVK